MVQDFLPGKAFYDRHEFLGRFSNGDLVTKDLQVALQFPNSHGGSILGRVLGNSDDHDSLAELNEGPDPLHTLTSAQEPDQQKSVLSYSVFMNRTTSTHYGGKGDLGIRSIIGEFHLHDIRVTQRITGGPGDDANAPHRVTFYLDGPTDAWMVRQVLAHSYTGDINAKTYGAELDLGHDFPFNVEVRPHHIREEVSEERSRWMSEQVMGITLETKKPAAAAGSEADFIREAQDAINDLCLLASFLCQRRVSWFRYSFLSRGLLQGYVRMGTKTPDNKRRFAQDGPVEWPKNREFFRIGMGALQDRRAEDVDLTLPITYYSLGCDAGTIEEQFTLFFLALEKLKDLYIRREGKSKILSDKPFRKLKRALKSIVSSEIRENDLSDRVIENLPSLNRPALRAVLEDLIASLDVEWKDLYPAGSEFTAIRTRNQVFHSADLVDPSELGLEAHRAQSLVERIILRFLGWQDLSCAPPHGKREWLQGKSGHSSGIDLVDAPVSDL